METRKEPDDGLLAGAEHAGLAEARTSQTDPDAVVIEFPLDRSSPFDAHLVAKYERIFPGVRGEIEAMRGRAMSLREIQRALQTRYQADVSPELICTIADDFLGKAEKWLSRPLDAIYAMVFFDALRAKVRDDGVVRTKAIHIALGVRPNGSKDIIGIWIAPPVSAHFWLQAIGGLKRRGVQDILIAAVDGTHELADAVGAAFPKGQVLTSIVHMVRRSLSFVSRDDKAAVTAVLRSICSAPNSGAAGNLLDVFVHGKWSAKYGAIADYWRGQWDHVESYLSYPDGVREILWTTNATGSMNAKLRRRALRTRGYFPSDGEAMKQLTLLLQDTSSEWKVAPKKWLAARAQLARLFPDRFPAE